MSVHSSLVSLWMAASLAVGAKLQVVELKAAAEEVIAGKAAALQVASGKAASVVSSCKVWGELERLLSL